ncbi:MAG: MATE family efflux transporter [Clostridia bacterium]
MFDNKALKRLIIPLVIDQFLAVTIGMADTMMVSSCGEAAVSGISLVDSINFLFITIFAALATGGAVVAAQYVGKGNKKESCLAANQLFYSVFFLSIILSIITLIFKNQILNLIYNGITEDVMQNARIYFFISALSYPFLAVFNASAALFRSMGDSKTAMFTSAFMNILNVLGNAIFIFIFNLGVAGAGLATLIARIIGAVIITILLFNQSRTICYIDLFKFKIKPKYIKNILYIGVPNGIENGLFQIGKLLVASIVSGFGTAAITANAIGGNLACIQLIPGLAISLALITVVGQCIGAGEIEQAKSYSIKLIKLTYIAFWGFSIVLFILLKPILSLYSISDEAAAITTQIFIAHLIVANFLWPLSFALPNALRAGGDVKFTMWISMLSMWIFRIGSCFLFAIYLDLGVFGVWIAMFADWACRGTFYTWRFFKCNWIKKRFT